MTSNLQYCRAVGTILCAFLALSAPHFLSAATVPCAERGASYRVVSPTDGPLEIVFGDGGFISWVELSGDPAVMIDVGSGFQSAGASGQFSAPASANSLAIKVDGNGAAIAVSCTQAGGGSNQVGATGTISASSQTFATTAGLGANSQSRFLDGTNVLSGTQVFLSSANMESPAKISPEWNIWASYEGRSYHGGIDGASFDLVGGIDRMVAPELFFGVLGGYGRSFTSDTGTAEESASPMIGGYFGASLGQSLLLDGFISYAQPAYQISGARFEASRLSAGVSLTGKIVRSRVIFEPFLKANGYQENQPGYTTGGGAAVASNATTTVAGSVGVRVKLVERDRLSALVPYISAAADFKRADTTLSGTDLVSAPRYGLGLAGKLGKGQMSLDIDLGTSRSDTFDQGVKFGYELNF